MDNLFTRKYIIQGFFIFVALALLVRLFYMQVLDDSYFLSANNNVLRKLYIFPERGVILDRNEKILVQNEFVYDLMVVPAEVHSFDTLDLCRLIGIDKEGFDKRFKKATTYSRYKANVFEKQLPIDVHAKLQEKLYRFPGFYFQNRTIRQYPDSIGAQFLGYVNEVNSLDIERSQDYYRKGDYIGKSGVERAYESLLRGQRGVTNMVYDARNVPQGSYAEGKYDTLAVGGERLISSLDKDLQKLGEQLMKNKVGSIVAIDPSTGEILSFVSSPTYDPNSMVGRDLGNHYMELIKDPYKPLNVRALSGYYSPGSSFKPIDALIALQEGVIDPSTTFYCPHYYMAGNHKVKCEHFDGVTDLRKGIAKSCNTYFCNVYQKLITQGKYGSQQKAYAAWREKIQKFGIGTKLGIDLPYERKGYLPTAEEYTKKFGPRWGYTTTISLAIGQGELSATPVQMANIMAIIANRGFYYKPHMIKAIGDKKVVKHEYIEKNYVGVDERHFEKVIDGMQDVVNMPGGTAYASRIPDVLMCGKTGTVQNPHGKNHAVFIGFAPRDNPKIAIFTIVENGGYGGSWAAPIASFMVEKYLKGKLTPRPGGIDPKRYMEANLLPEQPSTKPKYMAKKADTTKANTKTDTTKKTK